MIAHVGEHVLLVGAESATLKELGEEDLVEHVEDHKHGHVEAVGIRVEQVGRAVRRHGMIGIVVFHYRADVELDLASYQRIEAERTNRRLHANKPNKPNGLTQNYLRMEF